MFLRRIEDQHTGLVVARTSTPSSEDSSPADPSLEFEAYGTEGLSDFEATSSPSDAQGATFLLDAGGTDAILVSGAAIRRLPRGEGGDELMRRAVAGAVAWRREQVRVGRRLLLPELLISFADELSTARSVEDVHATLSRHSARIVGGFGALVLRRPAPGEPLYPAPGTSLPHDLGTFMVHPHPRFRQPGVIGADDARPETGGPYDDLAPLVGAGAQLVAHAPLEPDGVLMVIERRRDRVFEAGDWELLRTLTRQAAAAAERVGLFGKIRRLALTDPLTGLANRRHMGIMLERALSAARRGEPLTAVMIDLNDFKSVNDTRGHIEGDRLLMEAARCFQEEARGSDLVVRYGGDEFLVLFPGGTAAGARIYLDRARACLHGKVEFSAGIAEFTPRYQSGEELIEAADRDLYRSKPR